MIDAYVNDIRASLENKQYYSALSLALILPDICGSVEFPNKKVSERYIGWYDKYIGNSLENELVSQEFKMPYLSGEMVYNLRNTFLHNGQPDVIADKLKDDDNRIQKFKLYVCNEGLFREVTLSGKIDETPLKAILVDVRYLCRILSDVALYYFNENRSRFNFDSEIHICDKAEDLGLETQKVLEDMSTEYIKTLRGTEKVNCKLLPWTLTYQRITMNEITLDISGVVEKDGKKIAHIRFSRGEDFAEGYIPDCVLTKVQGFTDEESAQLEDYLRANLTEFKKRAAAINPLTALMGKTGDKK